MERWAWHTIPFGPINLCLRIVKVYEFEKSEKTLFEQSIDKYTAESFTRFLKIEQAV